MDKPSDFQNAPKVTSETPQGTATAPQGTATTPQGTATAPQGTATAPQGTATAPQGTSVPTESAAYSGTQADIIVQKGKILKLYKPGFSFNASVLPLVKSLKGKGFVVDLYDFGTMDYEGQRRAFELMEYCPEGAVSAVNLKGNKDTILKVVLKVAEALDACHRAGFIHKDVKPANILIRDKSKWNCVLCDFGIADVLDHGKVTTQQSRTPIYAAPEVYENTITIENRTYCELGPAADFYSLGMTILSLWYGESALQSKEKAQAMRKVRNGITVPTDIPDPLYTIARGLLTKEPAHRWKLKEIKDFLSGKKVDIYDGQRQNGGLNIVFNSSKQQIAHSPEELAAFMVEDQSLAIKYLYSGKVSKWLEQSPELQIEIENIVEKVFPNNQKMGLLAAIHTLNPFYDLQLCCDLNAPEYAMTGATIGNALNEVYYHYFTQNNADALTTCIAESFLNGNDLDYLPWFLDHKGNRFKQQRQWFDYCVKGDRKNNKKAGPKDSNYLHQVAIMKTIAGFGAHPVYRLSRTGKELRCIDDIHRAPQQELLYDLQNDKGIRGWLAVMCHEDPFADLKEKYNYEKLLEQYVKLIGFINPSDQVYRRFHQAENNVKDIASKAQNAVKDTRNVNILQKTLSIALGVVPLLILLTKIILNISDNQGIRVGSWSNFLVYGVGILAAAFYYFTNNNDGCFLPIVIGAIVAVVVKICISLIGFLILYIYGICVIGVLGYFSIKILFNRNDQRKKVQSVTNPGFEELTLEPLYYAFNNETVFDSSLNGAADIKSAASLREAVKKRWKMVIIFIGSALVLSMLRFAMPKSERMSRFERFLRNPFKTETVQHDEMQTMPDPEP